MSFIINAIENGYVPDSLVRLGIKKLIKQREEEIKVNFDFHKNKILKIMQESPLAIETAKANEQHYEVPSEFYQLVLGKNLKYSCSLFENQAQNLDEAEDVMLNLYCERAQIVDGMKILELGCGWGSLTLHLARKYPNSQITAISNSHGQREYILGEAQKRNIKNIKIITTDINVFKNEEKFDRIISIEMFEHLRNYQEIFAKMKTWLNLDGKVFLHIFCHKEATYFFETEGDDNWMGKYFFTGGVMPSFDLFERIQDSLKLEKKWEVNGINYQDTSEEWFKNMDRRNEEIMTLFEKTYGKKEAKRWFNRWKMFFAACAELFGHKQGKEWFVGHFLFKI
jgi:cyclopropane-fatty-acyl-phospholipid synthase